jgi:phage gp37-like protein
MDINSIRAEIITKMEELKPLTFKMVESFAGQLADVPAFVKKMPACLVHFGGVDFSEYSMHPLKAYETVVPFEIYVFTDVKKYKSKNIDTIESVVGTALEKIVEIQQITLKSVKQAWADNEFLSYVINVDYIPNEVING